MQPMRATTLRLPSDLMDRIRRALGPGERLAEWLRDAAQERLARLAAEHVLKQRLVADCLGARRVIQKARRGYK